MAEPFYRSLSSPIEERFDRFHQQRVGILEAIFLEFIGVSGELLGVHDQISALPVKIPIQPKSDPIWMSNFVGGELLAIDLGDIDHNLRA